MPDPLVVFGSGGHAKVVIEAVLARTPGREILILDDAAEAAGRSVLGITVSGGRALLNSLRCTGVALGVGNNRARSELIEWLRDNGFVPETIVHPSATIGASVTLGAGVFVSAGAIVIAEAKIADGAIVNTGATVDHDCYVAESAHVAPGTHLCGNVRVGARTLVGVGSSVRPGISICDDVILGAGSVVVRDISEPGVFAGCPARRLK